MYPQSKTSLLSKSLFVICAAAVWLAACGKNDNNDNNNDTDPTDSTASKVYLIKSYTDEFDGQVFNYTYDEKNRVKKEVRSIDGTLDFTYTDTSVIETRHDLNGNFTEKREYRLDANGLVKTAILDGYTESYTYNSDKQNTRTYTEFYNNSGKASYDDKSYYTNGNLDSTITIFSTSSGTNSYPSIYCDTYYTDKPNTLDYANIGSTWFGKGSKYLLKSGRGRVGPASVEPYTLTYQFDSLGRITKVSTSNNNAYPGTSNIVYY